MLRWAMSLAMFGFYTLFFDAGFEIAGIISTIILFLSFRHALITTEMVTLSIGLGKSEKKYRNYFLLFFYVPFLSIIPFTCTNNKCPPLHTYLWEEFLAFAAACIYPLMFPVVCFILLVKRLQILVDTIKFGKVLEPHKHTLAGRFEKSNEVLNFLESLTESIPQLGIQLYMFIRFRESKLPAALFITSCCFSALGILKNIFIVVFGKHTIFEILGVEKATFAEQAKDKNFNLKVDSDPESPPASPSEKRVEDA